MLERFLLIRRDERKSIFLLSILGLAWSISFSFNVALSDALLIEKAGTGALPLSFAITSIGLFLFSGFFVYLFNRKTVSQIFYLWTAISAGSYVVLNGLLFWNLLPTSYFVIYKAVAYIFQIGFYSCYWTFIDQYFELQNAKRLFGLFYSSIFLGTAISGAIIGLVSFEKFNFILLSAVSIVPLGASVFLIRKIEATLEKLPDDFEQFTVFKTKTSELIRSIVTSPFTLLLLFFCVVLQVLMVITEYEYMFGLQNYFIGRPEQDLTQFLGKLYFYGGVINIVFGVFLYGRMIKKAGLNNVLMLVPVFFLSLFCGWNLSSHLMFTLMGFTAVEGVMTMVEDNNFTLLLNAVPQKLKGKIRIISESLVEPFGILISSLLILVFKEHSKMMGLYLSLGLLAIGILMRAHYTKGIFYNLVDYVRSNKTRHHEWEPTLSRREFFSNKKKYLESFFALDEEKKLLVFESAIHYKDQKFLYSLTGKISKLPLEFKLQIMEILARHPKEITQLLNPYFSLWVKQEAEFYKHLVLHYCKMGLMSIEQLRLTPCVYSQASYALLLDQSRQSKPAQTILEGMLLSNEDTSIKVATEALASISKHPFNSTLIALLDKKPQLKETILKTLSQSIENQDEEFLPRFLSALSQEQEISARYLLVDCIEQLVTPKNLEAILNHTLSWKPKEKRDLAITVSKLGSSMVGVLVKVLEDRSLHGQIRLFSAQILAMMDKKLLKLSFKQIFDHEIAKAHLYYYHYITIQQSHPYTNLTVLKQALKHSYNSILDFLIQMQAFIQNFTDGDVLIQCLHSSHPKSASHSLETLQKMCSSKVYRQIQPLIEPDFDNQFFKDYHEKQLPILNLDELLDLLQVTPSSTNRSAVNSIKSRLSLTGITQ